jgi:ribonuclease HI
MIHEDALNIYTDGSSYSGPRTGGIGIRFITIDDAGHEAVEDFPMPGYKNATNNSMELYACVVALQKASGYPKISHLNRICIFTDSRYVVEHYKKAIFQWPKQKWLRRSGTPVLNAGLWKQLVREIKKASRKVEFTWVKGHSKNPHNKAVDKLAKQSAKNAVNDPMSIVTVRRKQTKKSVDIESVEMRGQRLAIRIITSEYLREHKLVKYKYEVLSKGSKYFGNVDLIYSTHDMRAGHHYKISVNRNTSNPRVLNVLRELER